MSRPWRFAREVKDRAGEGITLNNLGGAYWALSQYERAIGYFEQALVILREVQNRAMEGAVLTNLGAAYWALSQYERAIDYYEQALAIARDGQKPGRGRHHPEQPGTGLLGAESIRAGD